MPQELKNTKILSYFHWCDYLKDEVFVIFKENLSIYIQIYEFYRYAPLNLNILM